MATEYERRVRRNSRVFWGLALFMFIGSGMSLLFDSEERSSDRKPVAEDVLPAPRETNEQDSRSEFHVISPKEETKNIDSIAADAEEITFRTITATDELKLSNQRFFFITSENGFLHSNETGSPFLQQIPDAISVAKHLSFDSRYSTVFLQTYPTQSLNVVMLYGGIPGGKVLYIVLGAVIGGLISAAIGQNLLFGGLLGGLLGIPASFFSGVP